MCKLNKIFKAIILFSLFLVGGQAWAVSWYQVEVIVFDYTSPDLDGELWFENPGLPQRNDAIDLLAAIPAVLKPVPNGINQPLPVPQPQDSAQDQDNTPKNLVPYQALPEDKFRLRDDYRRLQLSSAYRPLLHVAWQQPGLDAAHVRQVHLEKLASGATTTTSSDNTAVADAGTAGPVPYVPPNPIVDGLVRLRSTDLLYVDIDFAYFPANFRKILESQADNAETPNNKRVNLNADYVRLTDSRKIRLNELNYFDHPLFGIILQVSRIGAG